MPHPTFADARRALETGEATCEALVASFLERIDAQGDDLNLFLSVDREGALAHARMLDGSGDERPLKGLVLGVKDTIAVEGRPLTCGSRMLEDFVSLYSATAVQRLRDAGAIVLGKLNCDEFAMGSSNETSYFGPARNPVDPDYVPGGSSGGSAAAVAAGFCHAALGSDTGGSVRLPAAFTGTVGLKPTYGRVSRYGLVAFASSLDVIGPLAHTVEDAARVLQAMAGADPSDTTSARVDVPDFAAALTGDPGSGPGQALSGLRVGLPQEYFAEGLDADVRAAVETCAEALKEAGATVREVSLPHTKYGVATYYILATAEASSNLGRYDGVRYGHRADETAVRRTLVEERDALEAALAAAEQDGDDSRLAATQHLLENHDTVLHRLYAQSRTEGFGDEVKRRIMLGTYVLSSGYYDAYYAKAQRVRTLIREDFDRAFEDVDVLLTPASPSTAFRLGEKSDDPLHMYLSDVYTVTANLAGIPGLVVPAPALHPNGLPIGLQLLAPAFDEATLLRAGDAIMRF
jgi:aspartyl-tRNA(Asn)/glutamyl-tRNA(Gln) amidotransferase subunit A